MTVFFNMFDSFPIINFIIPRDKALSTYNGPCNESMKIMLKLAYDRCHVRIHVLLQYVTVNSVLTNAHISAFVFYWICNNCGIFLYILVLNHTPEQELPILCYMLYISWMKCKHESHVDGVKEKSYLRLKTILPITN